MNTHKPAAERVLDRTLHELRRTRIKRKVRRAVLGTSAMGILAFAALFRPGPATAPVPPPQVATPLHHPTPPPERDKLVAMVWRDGVPTLEELAPDELGYPFYPYVQFSLEPVVAYTDPQWTTF